MSWLMALTPTLASTLTLTALLIFGAWVAATSEQAQQDCMNTFNECLSSQLGHLTPVQVVSQNVRFKCETAANIDSLAGGLEFACELSNTHAALGMSWWRWMLFCGLTSPTWFAARALGTLLQFGVRWYSNRQEKHAYLYLRDMTCLIAHIIRISIMLSVWFWIAHQPLDWAKRAPDVNSAASKQVWTTVFEDVHFVVWRLLLLGLLASIARLLSKLAGRAVVLKLSFVEHNHRTLAALKCEDSMRTCKRKCFVEVHASGAAAKLRGLERVHWEAMCFVDSCLSAHPSLGDACALAKQQLRRALHKHPQLFGNTPLSATAHLYTEDPHLLESYRAFFDLRASDIERQADFVRNASCVLLSGDSEISLDLVHRCVKALRDPSGPILSLVSQRSGIAREVAGVVWMLLLGVLVFVCIVLFNPGALSRVWTGASAMLITLSFVFGNSLRQLYENVVFLVSRHPFQEGDAIWLDGVKYQVVSLHLRCVVLVREDGYRVNEPMHKLLEAHVVNESRSRTLWDRLEFDADPTTDLSQCKVIANKVRDAIAAHGGALDGRYCVNLLAADAPGNKVKIQVCFVHAPCEFRDSLGKDAQSFIAEAVCKGMVEAGVNYTACNRVHLLHPDPFTPPA